MTEKVEVDREQLLALLGKIERALEEVHELRAQIQGKGEAKGGRTDPGP